MELRGNERAGGIISASALADLSSQKGFMGMTPICCKMKRVNMQRARIILPIANRLSPPSFELPSSVVNM
jgi:hypothetical protein